MIKILLVAGARPNFMKIAPILRAASIHDSLNTVLVHTGQHYDQSMSASFFNSLGIKNPDYNLEVGSGSHAIQTANIIIRFEEVCLKEKPDIVIVVGDVNSTIAASLVAKKLQIKLAHVEAGLRSGDRLMPEEINRLATDAISDIFFTTEKEGTENLLKEGKPEKSIHFVGHVMIDNLYYQLKNLDKKKVSTKIVSLKNKLNGKYCCMTMHRPSNVDNKDTFERILGALKIIANKVPIVFPCHPRTEKNIKQFGRFEEFKNVQENGQCISPGIYLCESMGYDDFLYLWKDAALVLTDSGGLQEETTALRIPCITMRETTERPVTVSIGSNVIAGSDSNKIIEYANSALSGNWKKSDIPDLWDGKASERIVDVLMKYFGLK